MNSHRSGEGGRRRFGAIDHDEPLELTRRHDEPHEPSRRWEPAHHGGRVRDYVEDERRFALDEDDDEGAYGDPRGFASMDEERRREIARMGARARWSTQEGYGPPPREQDEPRHHSSGWSRRGFASMDEQRRREISRRGGEASHASGHAHKWSSEEARAAGRLGGRARWGHGRREHDQPYEPREREQSYGQRHGYSAADEERERERYRYGEEERGYPPRYGRAPEDEGYESAPPRRGYGDEEERYERAHAEERGRWEEPEYEPRRSSRDEIEDERGGRVGGGRSRRGFASMDHDRLRQIASRGGRAAHESGHAHEWSSREARVAGRLGGRARWG